MTAALEGGWAVSSTPRPHFTPGKDPVSILQEAGWAPGPVWTGGSRPHRGSIPDRPAHSQSLYRLSYPAHKRMEVHTTNYILDNNSPQSCRSSNSSSIVSRYHKSLTIPCPSWASLILRSWRPSTPEIKGNLVATEWYPRQIFFSKLKLNVRFTLLFLTLMPHSL